MIEAKTIQKYKDKKLSQLVKIAQKHFNAYVRSRDSFDGYFRCISCNEIKPTSKMHAGHFYSVGNYQSVRFDLDNCHGQCHKCNTFLHGNLIKKIGAERFEQLERLAYLRGFKFDRITIIEIIERFKKIKK